MHEILLSPEVDPPGQNQVLLLGKTFYEIVMSADQLSRVTSAMTLCALLHTSDSLADPPEGVPCVHNETHSPCIGRVFQKEVL